MAEKLGKETISMMIEVIFGLKNSRIDVDGSSIDRQVKVW